MNIPRRQFVRLAASAAALPVTARLAWAQTYPTRPVRMIVPFAPGGPRNAVAGLPAEEAAKSGQAVLCRERRRAGGNLGTARGAGYARRLHPVLVSSSYMVNPSLYPKVPYDQAKDSCR
jgi:tripartite-type tricarboxylate transporter receptor subunit TctC